MPQNPVILVSYSANWPAEFRQLAAQIRTALGPLALRIDHIGSTSVPNLCSKNIIDIQVTVVDLDNPTLLQSATTAGFTLRPDILTDHIPSGHPDTPADWVKRYLLPPPNTRDAHIHVRLAGKPNQRYALLFRDYLRTHPAAATAYAQIKQRLAPKLERLDYVDAKDPVCDLIMQSAEVWAKSGWSRGPSDG